MKLHKSGVYLVNGRDVIPDDGQADARVAQATGGRVDRDAAIRDTMAWSIMERHNTSGDMDNLKIKFDSMASHDITYVGIIQTARASGLREFPIPYVLTNCHNSLCAVGGTINEDDHMFAVSAAKKYGGIYVPTHLAVIHQYMREMMAGCGKMILGSDSHTRYGALGTMAIGEGGGELAKQLLGRTYDLKRPDVIAVLLSGSPRPGVGPQDVALALVKAVFDNGYVKNKVLEFVGPGIAGLSAEYRNGIDVMTTETTCLSSIWATDDVTKRYLEALGRPGDYAPMAPGPVAYYQGAIEIDLAAIEPMIALPFHPSNAFPIAEFKRNAKDMLRAVEAEAKKQYGAALHFDLADKVRADGVHIDQGTVAGCAGGTYDNICAVADILKGRTPGNGRFSFSVYPSSQPTYIALVHDGVVERLMTAGVVLRSAFCGPCFGAGDVPANGSLAVRHTTRNFPNREGSKPGDGQLAGVALMDARSVAATAAMGGILTAATELDVDYGDHPYHFEGEVYKNRVYQGFGKAEPDEPLQFGPNITDWPAMPALTEHLLIKIASFITDPVTTTDELIPSGETSSYRSNPLRLAEFTLSRRDPAYVGKSKVLRAWEVAREEGRNPADGQAELAAAMAAAAKASGLVLEPASVGIGSAVYAVKPGDGSAREQAASCQKVLGGWANIAREYATKRYRSNLINWGILPFVIAGEPPFANDAYVFIPNIRDAVAKGAESFAAYALGEKPAAFELSLGDLTADERQILLDGCLINFYRE